MRRQKIASRILCFVPLVYDSFIIIIIIIIITIIIIIIIIIIIVISQNSLFTEIVHYITRTWDTTKGTR